MKKKKKKVVGVTWRTKGNMKKKEGGGVNVILEQNLRIAKVKNTVTLQSRQGKWIPLSCKFSQRKSNKFLYPVLFNTIIEQI